MQPNRAKCMQDINNETYNTMNENSEIKRIALNHVRKSLNGKARKIVCLEYPYALVWCESSESGVHNPLTGDLPEYAVIDRETGAIRWTDFADILNEVQRERIEASAAICAAKMGGFLHYTIGTEYPE